MIDVLLATHNGQAYLAEQLDSVLNQTYQDFRILIQDDGSRDGTLEIIREYCEAFPEKVRLCGEGRPPGGAARNFLSLAAQAEGDYVAFCDQDDVWLADKLEISMRAMGELEAADGGKEAALVFSGVCPVDQELRRLRPSGKKEEEPLRFAAMLVQNRASGCTMLCNRALYTRLGNYDSRILMHDWWTALVASALGRTLYLPQELVLYRQHGANAVGYTGRRSLRYWWKRAGKERPFQKKLDYYNQALLLRQRLGDAIEPPQRKILEEFLSIPEERCKILRMRALLTGGFRKDSSVAQAIYLISI